LPTAANCDETNGASRATNKRLSSLAPRCSPPPRFPAMNLTDCSFSRRPPVKCASSSLDRHTHRVPTFMPKHVTQATAPRKENTQAKPVVLPFSHLQSWNRQQRHDEEEFRNISSILAKHQFVYSDVFALPCEVQSPLPPSIMRRDCIVRRANAAKTPLQLFFMHHASSRVSAFV